MNPKKKGPKSFSPNIGWLGSPEIEEPEGSYRVIIKRFWMDYYFVWWGIGYCISHLIIKWPFAIFFLPPDKTRKDVHLSFFFTSAALTSIIIIVFLFFFLFFSSFLFCYTLWPLQ